MSAGNMLTNSNNIHTVYICQSVLNVLMRIYNQIIWCAICLKKEQLAFNL